MRRGNELRTGGEAGRGAAGRRGSVHRPGETVLLLRPPSDAHVPLSRAMGLMPLPVHPVALAAARVFVNYAGGWER